MIFCARPVEIDGQANLHRRYDAAIEYFLRNFWVRSAKIPDGSCPRRGRSY
jgi:hypothetical protein